MAFDFKLLKNKLHVLINPTRAWFLRVFGAEAVSALHGSGTEPLALRSAPGTCLVKQLH